jgi:hypothetical protein
MKYKTKRYILESSIDDAIDVINASSDEGISKSKDVALSIYDKTKIGFEETLRHIKYLNKKCSDIKNPLEKLYCSRYNKLNRIKKLKSLSGSMCNYAKDQNKCRYRVYKEINKEQLKLNKILQNIQDLETTEREIKSASRREVDIYYGNEYK